MKEHNMHLERLAEILGRCDSEGHLTKTNLFYHMGKWLKEVNPLFDSERFHKVVSTFRRIERIDSAGKIKNERT